MARRNKKKTNKKPAGGGRKGAPSRRAQRGFIKDTVKQLLDNTSLSATIGLGYNAASGTTSSSFGKRGGGRISGDKPHNLKRWEKLSSLELRGGLAETLVLSEHVNPANSTLFPWASQVALLYSMYRMNEFRVVVKPVNGTTVDGSITGGFTPSNVITNIDSRTVSAYGFSWTQPIWQEGGLVVPGHAMRQRPLYEITAQHPNDQFDPDQDVGRLDIVGMTPVARVVGDIWVYIDVDLYQPIARPSASPGVRQYDVTMHGSGNTADLEARSVGLGWYNGTAPDGYSTSLTDLGEGYGFNMGEVIIGGVTDDLILSKNMANTTQFQFPPGDYLVAITWIYVLCENNPLSMWVGQPATDVLVSLAGVSETTTVGDFSAGAGVTYTGYLHSESGILHIRTYGAFAGVPPSAQYTFDLTISTAPPISHFRDITQRTLVPATMSADRAFPGLVSSLRPDQAAETPIGGCLTATPKGVRTSRTPHCVDHRPVPNPVCVENGTGGAEPPTPMPRDPSARQRRRPRVRRAEDGSWEFVPGQEGPSEFTPQELATVMSPAAMREAIDDHFLLHRDRDDASLGMRPLTEHEIKTAIWMAWSSTGLPARLGQGTLGALVHAVAVQQDNVQRRKLADKGLVPASVPPPA